jgi:hypothetical protein
VVTPKPVPYSDFIAALMYRETTNPDNRTTYPSNSTISPIILECMEKRGRYGLLWNLILGSKVKVYTVFSPFSENDA